MYLVTYARTNLLLSKTSKEITKSMKEMVRNYYYCAYIYLLKPDLRCTFGTSIVT